MYNPFQKRRSVGSAVGIGAIGAAIGTAVTYYLYGTKNGAKKRAKIVQFAREMKDKTMDAADDAKDTVVEKIDQASRRFKGDKDEI